MLGEFLPLVLEHVLVRPQPDPRQIQLRLALLRPLPDRRPFQLLVEDQLVLELVDDPVAELVAQGGRVVLGRGEEGVEGEAQGVLHCPRNDPF